MITTHQQPGGPMTVRVDAELDMATHDDLRARFREVALQANGPVELDLGGLGFCDVTGVDIVREFVDTCRSRQCDVTIRNAPRLVRVIAEVVAVDLPFA